ncbi:uncharacterized protein LOC117652687 [Thrips palmi]|uniref:Uncharacterized protein LOC117652687 n=1 Tax=Thrips palmi TaxID=161013 RepID=A0A6P9A6S3_THRPL|nr:uncharacterized protein LOC117652687 [Thrips palmi]
MPPLAALLLPPFFLLNPDLVCSKTINTFAGPYISYTTRFDPCPSDGTFAINLRPSHFHPARPFERQTVSGNFTILSPFDETYWLRVDMAGRSNNQWKENAFIFNFPRGACSTLRDHLPDFFAMIAQGNPTKNVSCPLEASGTHEVKNEPTSWVFPKFKTMPYGRFKFTLRVGDDTNRAPRFCTAVDMTNIPRPA